MIVLAAVLLGALLPVPTGQAGLQQVCLSDSIDRLDDAIDDAASDLISAPQAWDAIGVETCASLCPNGTYGAVVNEEPTCKAVDLPPVPQCFTTATTSSADAMAIQPGTDCPIQSCPKGELGVAVGPFNACDPVGGGGDVTYLPGAKGGSCAAPDDGSGPGNPHASCKLSCGVGSALAIGVASADKPPGDATAYGAVNCGDAGGPCVPTPKVCFGASKGLARTADDAGTCDGYVDEWIDDPMVVACVASPGADFGDDDPVAEGKRIICDFYPDFPTCDQSFAVMSANCIAAHPELLEHGESVISGLFPPQFETLPVHSYVGGVFLLDGSVTTVSYNAGDTSCSVA